jgi:TRAP-type C4-dicarboxylate transport system substrate-binding protein
MTEQLERNYEKPVNKIMGPDIVKEYRQDWQGQAIYDRLLPADQKVIERLAYEINNDQQFENKKNLKTVKSIVWGYSLLYDKPELDGNVSEYRQQIKECMGTAEPSMSDFIEFYLVDAQEKAKEAKLHPETNSEAVNDRLESDLKAYNFLNNLIKEEYDKGY